MPNLLNSKIIYLTTSARGGSKLFHSLLENHPDIICFPRTFRMSIFLKSLNYELDNCELILEKFTFLTVLFKCLCWLLALSEQLFCYVLILYTCDRSILPMYEITVRLGAIRRIILLGLLRVMLSHLVALSCLTLPGLHYLAFE